MGKREYSLKVKRAAGLTCRLVVRVAAPALPAALLFILGASGCRGRDEGAAAVDAPLDHSKKSSSSLSSPSLPFAALSFDEALVRARAEKKLVFVDLSADWCSYCTRMDDEVFTDSRVRTALLTFVPIKLDTDTAGGRGVANRYRVNGLPAFLLVDGDGALVGRFDGYLPVDPFLVQLRRASGGRG